MIAFEVADHVGVTTCRFSRIDSEVSDKNARQGNESEKTESKVQLMEGESGNGIARSNRLNHILRPADDFPKNKRCLVLWFIHVEISDAQ